MQLKLIAYDKHVIYGSFNLLENEILNLFFFSYTRSNL